MSDLINIEAWREVLVSSLSELGTTIAGFLPNLVGMLVILLVGWGISRLTAGLFRRLLHRAGLDRGAERLGVAETLRSAGLALVPSEIVSRLIFWILMLTFLLSAVETLGLEAVTATIDRLIAYLPNVIAAAFIVVVGLLLARFVQSLVSSGAATANLVYARQLGSAAHGAVVVMVGVLTAQQLGVDTQLLMTVITALIAAAALAIGLSFALGSREVVGAILASHYIRQSLAEGDVIEIEDRKGRVERIGPVDTLLRDGESSWSVPNVKLLRETIGR
jgi:hypothetical protein